MRGRLRRRRRWLRPGKAFGLAGNAGICLSPFGFRECHESFCRASHRRPRESILARGRPAIGRQYQRDGHRPNGCASPGCDHRLARRWRCHCREHSDGSARSISLSWGRGWDVHRRGIAAELRPRAPKRRRSGERRDGDCRRSASVEHVGGRDGHGEAHVLESGGCRGSRGSHRRRRFGHAGRRDRASDRLAADHARRRGAGDRAWTDHQPAQWRGQGQPVLPARIQSRSRHRLRHERRWRSGEHADARARSWLFGRELSDSRARDRRAVQQGAVLGRGRRLLDCGRLAHPLYECTRSPHRARERRRGRVGTRSRRGLTANRRRAFARGSRGGTQRRPMDSAG